MNWNISLVSKRLECCTFTVHVNPLNIHNCVKKNLFVQTDSIKFTMLITIINYKSKTTSCIRQRLARRMMVTTKEKQKMCKACHKDIVLHRKNGHLYMNTHTHIHDISCTVCAKVFVESSFYIL